MLRYGGIRSFTKTTSCGHPFKVWREEPLVPRFDNRFLDCSLYLYPTEAEAKRGENIGGSGFLAVVDGITAGEISSQSLPLHYYAVSNRHVAKSNPVVRLNNHNGTTDVIPLSYDDWVWTDDQDVAVVPLSYNPAHKYLFVSVVSLFLTKDIARQADVGIGDEVFMIGRLVNHSGKQQNSPSLRWGHISMMPFEPVYHLSNSPQEQESFLVEVHSVSGYSGSPVFVRPFSTHKLLAHSRFTEAEIKEALATGCVGQRMDYIEGRFGGPWLLGVEWGYINNHKQRENNTGISGVVPAWHVTDLLNSERLKMQRAQEQVEREELLKNGGTTLT
jgi:hypothetical protein